MKVNIYLGNSYLVMLSLAVTQYEHLPGVLQGAGTPHLTIPKHPISFVDFKGVNTVLFVCTTAFF